MINIIDEYLMKLKNGDMEALGKLYDCTYKKLFGLCFSYLKNHHVSEEALSDVYVRIYENIDKYNGKNGITWMSVLTKNVCLNKLRDKKIELRKDMNDYSYINNEIANEIIDISKRILNDKEFRIVMLHAMYGYKFKEIATILGGFESTVRGIYNRALEKVRKEMK